MMVYTARGRRERTARRILHTAWCRSGWSCRGDNEHAFRSYRSIGAEVAAAPDRDAVLAILDKRCPVAAMAAEPYVGRLLHALNL